MAVLSARVQDGNLGFQVQLALGFNPRS
jgi:hypothetical protein